MTASNLLQESIASPTSIPGLNNNSSVVSCALCGVPIFPSSELSSTPNSRPPVHPAIAPNGNSWSTSIFKRQRAMSTASRPPSPPPRSRSRPPAAHIQQVYIFRVSGTGVTTYPSLPNISTSSFTPPSFASNIAASSSFPSQPPSHPTHHSTNSSSQSSTIYPLCSNGWCLTRLRATCSLWAFVRNGIVEKVWEEEVPNLPSPATPSANGNDKPPVPPRRRGLWGMATALGERAASWSESDKDKSKKLSVSAPPTPEKRLPPAPVAPTPRPPPVHPTVSAVSNPAPAPVPSNPEPPIKAPSTPPPLPKRNEGRNRGTPTTPTAKMLNGDSMFPSPTETAVAKPPSSPTRVPLPESRPGTPSTPVVGSTAAVPPAVPSRTASPAPGAPPPLPRRAAGRRPTSMLASKVESSVDGNGDEKDAAREGEVPVPAPVEGSSAEVAKDSVSAPAERSEVTSGEATSSEVVGATEEDGAKKANADDAENAVSAPSSGEGEATKEESTAEPAKTEEGPASTADPEAPVAQTGEAAKDSTLVFDAGDHHDDEAAAMPSSEEESGTKTEVSETVVSTLVNGDIKSEPSRASEEREDESSEVYIGDATWEERTWKEVIRLKEVMFWARVGGIRVDE